VAQFPLLALCLLLLSCCADPLSLFLQHTCDWTVHLLSKVCEQLAMAEASRRRDLTEAEWAAEMSSIDIMQAENNRLYALIFTDENKEKAAAAESAIRVRILEASFALFPVQFFIDIYIEPPYHFWEMGAPDRVGELKPWLNVWLGEAALTQMSPAQVDAAADSLQQLVGDAVVVHVEILDTSNIHLLTLPVGGDRIDAITSL